SVKWCGTPGGTYRTSPVLTMRTVALLIEALPPLVTSRPSVLATAVPAVTIHRSDVVSCVNGGSSPATMRTLALMFVGPSNRRELLRLSASFSFHRASMSAAGQNIVLPVASLGTAGVAGPAPRPACPACWAYDAAAQSAITHIGARALLRIPLPHQIVFRTRSSECTSAGSAPRVVL